MFVGHYAAALAGKAIAPATPLWTYVVGAQLVDIGWASLVMADIEHFRINPALPGSSLDLYHMPYTHSLPAAVIWALAGAFVFQRLLKLPAKATAVLGGVILSHWLLDYLVHRPDLEIWIGGPKVGLAWWNFPIPELILELGLIMVAGAFWANRRGKARRSAWPAGLFLAVLCTLQMISLALPSDGATSFQRAQTALYAFIAVAVMAFAADFGKRWREG